MSDNGRDIEKIVEAVVVKKSDTLILADLGITSVPRSITHASEHLSRIALSGNKLRTIPDELSYLKSLKYLNLKGNLFREFPSAIFKIQSLEVLDMSKNRIEKIVPEIQSLQNLKVLCLSKNLIRVLPRVLCSLKSLKLLKISNNPIKFPPPAIMSTYDENESTLRELLRYIDIHDENEGGIEEETSGENTELDAAVVKTSISLSEKILGLLLMAGSDKSLNIPPQVIEDLHNDIKGFQSSGGDFGSQGERFQKLKTIMLETCRFVKQFSIAFLESTTPRADTIVDSIGLARWSHSVNVLMRCLMNNMLLWSKESFPSLNDNALFDFVLDAISRSSQLISELEREIVATGGGNEENVEKYRSLIASIQKVDRSISRLAKNRALIREYPENSEYVKKFHAYTGYYIDSFLKMSVIFKDISKDHIFDKSVINTLHACINDAKLLAQRLPSGSKA